MSADDLLLDRATIEHAFRRLGDRLARRGIVADLYVFGGAAISPPTAHSALCAIRSATAISLDQELKFRKALLKLGYVAGMEQQIHRSWRRRRSQAR